MTDVEKYGLFALVFVVVIVAAAWILEPGDLDSGPGLPTANTSVLLQRPEVGPSQRRTPGAARAQPVPERQQSESAGRDAGSQRPIRYRVASLIDEQQDFSFEDAPVKYPGERSAGQPESEQGVIQHTVLAEETLSDISKRYYDTAHQWRQILAANPGLKADKLQVGQVIVVPRQPSRGQPASGGRRIYVVQQGDTLSEIAASELGSMDRTQDLFLANRDLLSSPDQLKVGMHLRIP